MINIGFAQEMTDSLTDELQRVACDRSKTCSRASEIDLRDSTIICPDPDSNVGTYSATLVGPDASVVLERIQQASLSIDLGNGITLTLSSCDDCPSSTGRPIVQGTTSGLLTSVMVSFIIVAMVILLAILLSAILCYKFK